MPDKKMRQATNDIFEIFSAHKLSTSEGTTVLSTALLMVLIRAHYSKQRMHELMEKAWSEVQEFLHVKRGEEYIFEMNDELKNDAARDPALAAALRDVSAKIRQALDGIAIGRYRNIKEAMESLGAVAVEVEDDDD
jgi:hypothetical protein